MPVILIIKVRVAIPIPLIILIIAEFAYKKGQMNARLRINLAASGLLKKTLPIIFAVIRLSLIHI